VHSWAAADPELGNSSCAETIGERQTINCDSSGFNRKNCVSGPGNPDGQFAGGYPIPKYWSLGAKEFETDFNIASPMSKGLVSNVYVANYVKFCEDPTDPLKYNVAGLTAYSAMTNEFVSEDQYTSIKYAGGPLRERANPFYMWTCYDQAKDVKARIRVVVRDWNKEFSPSADYLRLAYPDSGAIASQQIMDLEGLEYGTNNGDWLDFYDWDDNYTATPPSILNCNKDDNGASPNLANERLNFPGDEE